LILLFALLSIAYCDNYGTYPSTWPFTVPVMTGFPDTTPDFTFTKTDPGGYHDRGLFNHDFLANQTGPVFYMVPYMSCFYYLYHFLTNLDQRNVQLSSFNCTKYKMSSSMLSGVVGSTQVCKAPNCCKYYDNQPTYTNHNENYLTNEQNVLSSILTSGGCNVGNFAEVNYCQYMNYFPHFCIQYLLTRNTRSFLGSCLDVDYNYVITCPVIKSVGYSELIKTSFQTEPPKYASSLTVLQSVVIYFSDNGRHVDRICHPYSYYYPSSPNPSPVPPSSSSISSYLSKFSLIYSLSIIFIFFY